LRASGDHHSTITAFTGLEGKFSLLPTEAYALGYSFCVVGDTVRAKRYFLMAAEKGTPAGLLEVDRDSLLRYVPAHWYASMNRDYVTWCLMLYPFVDGPNGTIPAPTTRINRVYQHVIDSLSGIYGGYSTELRGHEAAQKRYTQVRKSHDAVMDSILAQQLPLPSISSYGMNGEFDIFLLHLTPEYLFSKRDTLLAWLEKGWIYPRTYAACFDQINLDRGAKVPYGALLGYPPEYLQEGYEGRRLEIGMGSDAIDCIRFHWFCP